MRTRPSVVVPAAVLAVALGWAAPPPAEAQNPVIALRTNGSIMRPGDCLRLELLALDYLAGPLSPQVTYRYNTPVVIRDKEGTETTSTRAAEVQRPAGPVADAFNRLQLHLLDDTFCFGQGGFPGRYDIEVALRPGASGTPYMTLRTCVLFEDPDAPARTSAPACGFLVRGLTRAESDDQLLFDADLPSGGFYRGAILRGGTVEAVLEAGISQTGTHELSVLVPASSRSAAGVVDLVVVEQAGMASSTVSRLSLPPVR
jgi:hypothetical protein